MLVPVAAADAGRARGRARAAVRVAAAAHERCSRRSGTRSSAPARSPASSTRPSRRARREGLRPGGPRARPASPTPPDGLYRLARARSSASRPGTSRRCRRSRRSARSACSPSAAGWRSRARSRLGTFLAFSTYLVQLVAPVRHVRRHARRRPAGPRRRRAHLRAARLEPRWSPSSPTRADLAVDARRGRASRTSRFGYLQLGAGARRLLAARRARRDRRARRRVAGRASRPSACCCPASTTCRTAPSRIDGVDVRDVTLDSLRREIGVVFEDASCSPTPSAANIAYGRPDATDDEVERAARAAGRARVHRPSCPTATTPWSASAGSRSRAASASASPSPARCSPIPRVLVLDDATSAVDAAHRGGDPRHAARAHGGPHDDPDRPPPLDPAARRPHRRDRRTAGSSTSGTHEELLAASPRYRALLTGPGDDADDADAVDASSSTPSWRRRRARRRRRVDGAARWRPERRRRRGRARSSRPAGPRGRRAVAVGGGGRRRGVGGGLARSRPRPSCSPRSTRCRPPTTTPRSTSPRKPRRAEALPAPARSSARSARRLLVGFALVVRRHAAHARRPVPRAARHRRGRAAPRRRRALGSRRRCSSSRRSSTGSSRGRTRAYTGRTAERLLYALRIRIFAHLQRLSLDYYDREMAGRIMTRMTTDVEALSQLLQTGLITRSSASSPSSACCVVLLILVSWPLTLGVLVLVPPLVLATVWFRRVARRRPTRTRARRDRHRERRTSRRASPACGSRRRTCREDRNVDRFRTTAERVPRRPPRARSGCIALYFPFVLLPRRRAATRSCSASAACSCTTASLTAGILIAFLLYLDQFFAPIQQLSQVFDTWQQARGVDDQDRRAAATRRASTPDAGAIPSCPADAARRRSASTTCASRYPAHRTRDPARRRPARSPPGETVALVGETGAASRRS